jgi:hypothetical protein
MDVAAIYAKTALGVREIRERTLNLPVPMRGLLIMIDGRRTVGDILEKARVLRLDDSAFEALEVGGLIARKFALDTRASNDEAIAPVDEGQIERFRQAQRSIGDAIDAHLGLRGYALMLRVQRSTNLGDLRELLRDFANALVRRIGIDAAAPIVSRIEAQITPK